MVEKIKGYDIKINDNSFMIGTDSMNLLEFIKIENVNNILIDIGSGTGILTFSLIDKVKKIYSVEIQKEIYETLLENVIANNLLGRIECINSDIENVMLEKVDIIVSNPPYFKLNSGKMPEKESLKISKFEVKLDMDKLFKNAKRLIKENGRFYLIYPLFRNKELDEISKKYNFKTIREKIVGFKKKYILKEYIYEVNSGIR